MRYLLTRNRAAGRCGVALTSARPGVERAMTRRRRQAPWWDRAGARLHVDYARPRGSAGGVAPSPAPTLDTYLREEHRSPAGSTCTWTISRARRALRRRRAAAAEPPTRRAPAAIAVGPPRRSGLRAHAGGRVSQSAQLSGTGIVNTRSWRGAEVPSTTATATRRPWRALAAHAGEAARRRARRPPEIDRPRRTEQVERDGPLLSVPRATASAPAHACPRGGSAPAPRLRPLRRRRLARLRRSRRAAGPSATP